MVRDATITVPRLLHKKLKKVAYDQESSMNRLVNAALVHLACQEVGLRLG
jgi:hypothetical protein